MFEELPLKLKKKNLEDDFEIQVIVKNGSDLADITNIFPRYTGALKKGGVFCLMDWHKKCK